MERQLFDWESWDQIDTAEFQFYDCLLKVDIGEHKAGETIHIISIDYQNGKLVMHHPSGRREEYDLEVRLK